MCYAALIMCGIRTASAGCIDQVEIMYDYRLESIGRTLGEQEAIAKRTTPELHPTDVFGGNATMPMALRSVRMTPLCMPYSHLPLKQCTGEALAGCGCGWPEVAKHV